MKGMFIYMFIIGVCSTSYAQQDLINELAKQVVKIDSLTKVIDRNQQGLIKEFARQVVKIDSFTKAIDKNQGRETEYQVHLKSLQDSIRNLQEDLSELKELRGNKKSIDEQLQLKSDSVTLLKSTIIQENTLLLAERQSNEQKMKEVKEKGKSETISGIINSYKTETFDDLIKSSTKQSVRRDLPFASDIPEVKELLSDLEKYFNAKELLGDKFDAVQMKKAQNQLDQIKQKSILLDKLKELVNIHQTLNEGLVKTIKNIMVLDEQEVVSGLSGEDRKLKFNKILTEVSSYVFHYDFNFSDYPYLSDIVLKIIKRKQPNPDADISDLLGKL